MYTVKEGKSLTVFTVYVILTIGHREGFISVRGNIAYMGHTAVQS
jgi:hypothetical protein